VLLFEIILQCGCMTARWHTQFEKQTLDSDAGKFPAQDGRCTTYSCYQIGVDTTQYELHVVFSNHGGNYAWSANIFISV
jgi:hypothetical protein